MEVMISVMMDLLLATSKVQADLILTDRLCDLIGLHMMMLVKYVSYN